MSDPGADPSEIEFDHEELRVFWDLARFHAKLNAAPSYFGPTTLESVPPPAWSFGESAADSDAFVDEVLAADGGSTRALLDDYDGDVPEAGVLSILCDGAGRPRALVEVTEVATEASTGSQEVVERFRVVYSG